MVVKSCTPMCLNSTTSSMAVPSLCPAAGAASAAIVGLQAWWAATGPCGAVPRPACCGPGAGSLVSPYQGRACSFCRLLAGLRVRGIMCPAPAPPPTLAGGVPVLPVALPCFPTAPQLLSQGQGSLPGVLGGPGPWEWEECLQPPHLDSCWDSALRPLQGAPCARAASKGQVGGLGLGLGQSSSHSPFIPSFSPSPTGPDTSSHTWQPHGLCWVQASRGEPANTHLPGVPLGHSVQTVPSVQGYQLLPGEGRPCQWCPGRGGPAPQDSACLGIGAPSRPQRHSLPAHPQGPM